MRAGARGQGPGVRDYLSVVICQRLLLGDRD